MKKKRNWPRIALAVVMSLLVLAGAVLGGTYYYLFHVNEFYLDLRLSGEENITLEYGQHYEETGATAFLRGTKVLQEGRDVTQLLTICNAVNEEVLGTYYVEYSLRYRDRFLDLVADARRTVIVEDTCSPVITLVSDPGKFTIPGQPYEEEGYAASDNYDGDLTSQVSAVEQDGVVNYYVEDSSGNPFEISRDIFYHDPVAPELTLLGETSVTITEGSGYTDPGYTAMDNVDGDITDRVQVEGTVNTGKVGTYTLSYTVTDSYGNSAAAERIVTVKEKPKPVIPQPDPDDGKPKPPPQPDAPSGDKVIYLTFDDGPSRHTPRLLDVLDKYNVKATFFVVKTSYLDILPRMAQSGHSIGIHSASHVYRDIYASEEAYYADLETMKKIICDYTGIETTLVRFPGGSSNTASSFNPGIMTRLAQSLEEEGYQYFDWNVDSLDAGGAYTSRQVFQNVAAGVEGRSISIVLQHDTNGFSVDAVESIIIWGLENGYVFKGLDASSPTAHHRINN